jgi:hypothetical protein
MLDSAFIDKLYGQPKTKAAISHLKKENKVWCYVGRFITGFAMLEYQVNQLCEKLLDSAAGLLLTYTLDLRKKLDLIEVILESKGIDEKKTFKRLHELHDLRNILAHWPFSEELGEIGLLCDYIDKRGEITFRKPRASTKDNLIEYSELDSYDRDAAEIHEKLEHILSLVTPIEEGGLNDELRQRIEDAISSSDNIVRFPEKREEQTEDESQ